MMTAQDFLRKPDYGILPALIRSDAARLKREFLAIASDSSAPYLFRTKSLRILNLRAKDFGGYTNSDGASLIAAFDREFPPPKLGEIGTIIRDGSYHFDCWMVLLFCVALARIAPQEAERVVDSVRNIFKGTFRESSLNGHLQLISLQRRRSDS
jgi:hypothetical protein